MPIVTDDVHIDTRGDGHIVDVSEDVAGLVRSHGFVEGHVLVFVPGATAGVTTIEYEPGLRRDFPDAMARFAPEDIRYLHDDTWHDGNGHSHVRASLLGPSLMVPFAGGTLLLGTWQQIVVVDFDNRPRSRRLVVQLSGERRADSAASS